MFWKAYFILHITKNFIHVWGRLDFWTGLKVISLKTVNLVTRISMKTPCLNASIQYFLSHMLQFIMQGPSSLGKHYIYKHCNYLVEYVLQWEQSSSWMCSAMISIQTELCLLQRWRWNNPGTGWTPPSSQWWTRRKTPVEGNQPRVQ